VANRHSRDVPNLLALEDMAHVRLLAGLIIVATGLCGSVDFAGAVTLDQPDPYAGRNGEAEALADIARGRPPKVYYRDVCGDHCRKQAAGLLNCNPERFDTQKAPKTFFVPIPEADADSDYGHTQEQNARRHSAFFFAKSYNLTMFRKRKREILRVCPAAAVAE
jgi:hypothetical protein